MSICSVTVCNGYVTVCITDTRECNGYPCIQVGRESDKNWQRYEENSCDYMSLFQLPNSDGIFRLGQNIGGKVLFSISGRIFWVDLSYTVMGMCLVLQTDGQTFRQTDRRTDKPFYRILCTYFMSFL